jgi:hypothetical protein
MTTAAVTHWKDKAHEIEERYKRFKASIREQSEHAGQILTGTMLTAGGGALAAVLDEKFPTMPVVGGDSKLVIGMALTAVALLDLAGDYGEQMSEIGSGLLAVVTHEATKGALTK